MKMIETTARTSDEAIEIALKELDAERGDVEIDVVSKGKSGILGIGAELARVRVTLIETQSDVVKVTSEILESLIAKMGVDAVVNLKSSYQEDVGGPVFDIDGDDSGLLIGRRGETLRYLQFLVGFLASRRLEDRVNLFIDVSEPMPPNERRVVHMALSDFPGVETTSIGDGDGRQVVVGPTF